MRKKFLSFAGKILIFTMFLGWSFSAPPASAGLLSFLENLFTLSTVQTATPVLNSQTLSLLENTYSIDQGASTGGGDITIV
ncbi:hypothetical protein KJ763_01960, partial [Patescibacteria group bacterium]|nr:hypothetical protein [Patescibacteria group bacterium]